MGTAGGARFYRGKMHVYLRILWGETKGSAGGDRRSRWGQSLCDETMGDPLRAPRLHSFREAIDGVAVGLKLDNNTQEVGDSVRMPVLVGGKADHRHQANRLHLPQNPH